MSANLKTGRPEERELVLEGEDTVPGPREVELRQYLTRVGEDSAAPVGGTAERAWKAWEWLRSAVGGALSVPDAAPGPDGQILYTWDRDEHHFEMEVYPAGAVEFFYRNRKTGVLWDEETPLGEPIPEEALAKLRLAA